MSIEVTTSSLQEPQRSLWPLWQKIVFRFLFIYFVLYINPWTWISSIPGGEKITRYYDRLVDWMVNTANDSLFHAYNELVPPNGSGDTSYAWTMLWLFLLLSVAGALVWSVLDRRRNNYNLLAYWFRLLLRYFIIINCLLYGLIKIFGLQMGFPSLSNLATPLGDLLPMRLSWMYMGYSLSYQVFTGILEVFAGVLMLYRRTASFGTLVAAGVFFNVMMMNLGYDIPVKLFSIHLVVMCLILLAFEYKRFWALLTNHTMLPGTIYQFSLPKKWMRIGRIILKLAFVFIFVVLEIRNEIKYFKQVHTKEEMKPIKPGIYEVQRFVVNNDTIPYSYTDSLRWDDMIFDYNGRGSVKTADTAFRQMYRRGYFNYSIDSTNQTISFTRSNWAGQRFDIFDLHYHIPDSNSIILSGLAGKDSIWVELRKVRRHYQLTEKQFHWLSEYNR